MKTQSAAFRLMVMILASTVLLATGRAQTAPRAPEASAAAYARTAPAPVLHASPGVQNQTVPAVRTKHPHSIRNTLIIFAAIGGAVVLFFALRRTPQKCSLCAVAPQ